MISYRSGFQFRQLVREHWLPALISLLITGALGFGLGWTAPHPVPSPCVSSMPIPESGPTVEVGVAVYDPVKEWERLTTQPSASTVLGRNATCLSLDAYLNSKELDRKLAKDNALAATFQAQTHGVTPAQVHERFVTAATNYAKILYREELSHPPLHTCNRFSPAMDRGQIQMIDILVSILHEIELEPEQVLGVSKERLRQDKAVAIRDEMADVIKGRSNLERGCQLGDEIRTGGFTRSELGVSRVRYKQFLNACK